ncbi:Holliday junction branch migration protein RuvA [Demequina muriae]|uniref:Holliday junction branch migration complex subunit RuvA n=1 Tax=Demequina muriae TaxID=3051664 RepID=A0ABT8GJP0_9MICO|nr:Holliday junction branch migration protein RuvA [Demequina sp. EGI L300058]MDN4481652.1 Holliday junction branch migration protein RuvA [Demequina sp. EGI L300058]
MISQLAGTVLSVRASTAVVEVGGVGLLVHSTPATLAELRAHQEARFFTQLVVREESLTLFGFTAESERDTFEALQSVQGVGPRLALAMLAVHSPESLSQAVANGDRKALEQVPGIGAKVAARLLLELGGKLSLPESSATPTTPDARDQVEEALVALGWNQKAAAKAVENVAPKPIVDADVPTTLKAALKAMGGARA